MASLDEKESIISRKKMHITSKDRRVPCVPWKKIPHPDPGAEELREGLAGALGSDSPLAPTGDISYRGMGEMDTIGRWALSSSMERICLSLPPLSVWVAKGEPLLIRIYLEANSNSQKSSSKCG